MIQTIKKAIIQRQLSKREITNWRLEEVEQKQSQPNKLLFNDSSYFNGIDTSGSFFLSRMSFRTDRTNEHWLEFYHPELGLLRRLSSLGEEGDGFNQGALSFICLSPAKQWSIQFEGTMQSDAGTHQVVINMKFEAKTPLIDFQHAMIPENTAEQIAKEKWSRSFFQKLKEIKKMHFEQGGVLSGTISVDGKEQHYQFRSMRDHSWGLRKWSEWDRHIWICGMLDNGDCINISMIKYNYLGQLAAGFYIKDQKVSYLREFPPFSVFQPNHSIVNTARINVAFEDDLQAQVEWELQHMVPYDMDHGEYTIFEGISKGTVNSIPIRMVTEFGFNPLVYKLV